MALSRKYLAGMGLTEEQVNAIIEANEETITALKDEIDKHRTAEETATKQLAKVQKEMDALKKEAEESGEKNPYKTKYEALKEDFDAFKADVANRETTRNKTQAYKALLKEVGIAEKRIDAVARLADLEKITLDKDGKIEGADDLKKALAEEWADFIPTKGEEGASTATPPAGGATAKTKEEILAIKDTAARQQAMLENKALFIQ